MTEVNNEYDEIIFDYLEGNLSENERSAFEILLSSNQELRDQVRAWRNTYVLETFPITKDLETHIAASNKRRTWTFSLNSLVFILTIGLFIPSPLGDMENIKFSQQTENTVSSSSEVEALYPHTSEPSGQENISKFKTTIEATEVKVSINELEPLKEELTMLPAPDTEGLRPMLGLNNRRIEHIQEPASVATRSNVKKLSRQEIRLINRKKRAEYNLNAEREFLKGNVPYVVPLEITNF